MLETARAPFVEKLKVTSTSLLMSTHGYLELKREFFGGEFCNGSVT